MTETRWKQFSKQKQVHPDALALCLKRLRKEGRTIATLNGSFDLLHAGHLYMLYEASLQADVLFVLLNSDSSIRQYKGDSRPIVPLESRVELLTAIEFVDFVSWFDETDPREILKIIAPDVHVNGEEYGQECIEAPVVYASKGRLHLVNRIDGLSTSAIIEKCASSEPSLAKSPH